MTNLVRGTYAVKAGGIAVGKINEQFLNTKGAAFVMRVLEDSK
jgi:hypothetical protein